MSAFAPPPSGTGCVECLAGGGWWLHLRRCITCGEIRCCDSSPAQHASRHAREAGHPVAASFEPGEDWFWNYVADAPARPVPLSPPTSRPVEQASPGPDGRVPDDWRLLLH
ncbi:UBP-type zinc finger domain-containing protein [Agromyces sp. ISL-38]|uniref:UBP-type zinc finger domain-containing protein n=1 Tax=Agromyces sp. ISL-38 TaxID=2819107 RepID=UPI001BE83D48|nr:UBP-type zinc finger domain-containing protein [Agromyces sp. ISL-38]MBT2498732.1 UBP-type zinc finger domain-containing protein [Agromyces sp. ISL-38]MBT2518599.1 UBP-type zinc finger domain-containing protein [Streptomyces sp. ISL-90]